MEKIAKSIGWVLSAVLILAAPPVFAAGPVGISISGAVIPFDGGYAGSGYGAPEYDDAFDVGRGVRFEPYYDFNRMLRGVLGVTRQSWSGKSYAGFDFGDLDLWALYAGVKFRFLPDSAVRPYVLGDLGYAKLESVDISTGGSSATYWNSTDTFYVDFGGGAEFVMTPNFSLFIDFRVQVFGEPDSELGWTSEAEDGVSVPISVGLNLTF